MVLLNGKLEIVVIEARGLPDLDNNVLNADDITDPYCVVEAIGAHGSKRLGKTFTIDDCLNPKWYYKIITNISHDVDGIEFTVKDKDLLSSETVGKCYVNVLSFINSSRKYTSFENLMNAKGKAAGSLRVEIRFTGAEGVEKISSGAVKNLLERKKNRDSTKESSGVFLHGSLDVFIEKATSLPNMDSSFLSLRKKDVSDPFVTIVIQDDRGELWKVAVTSVIDDNLNPIWNEKFHINVCHNVVSLMLIIRDKDFVSSEEIGQVLISGEELFASKKVMGPLEIFSKLPHKKQAHLFFHADYTTTKDLSTSFEVPNCVFPLRYNNNITLYQDAHGIELATPIFYRDEVKYKQPRAWQDIYNAIEGATQYIYIIGWSVNVKISLLRWDGEDDRSIGDILVQKANKGVHVVVMIWDEVTSTELNKEGFMSTSDQATADFFRHTKVECLLVPRERKKTHMISTKQHFTNLCYTHHQKCIITDGITPSTGERDPIAFVGGLDIAKGRFDTPDHNLFSTLKTDHKKDFHNNLIITNSQCGPRQPWHDIHSKIEGEAAYDLLTNFNERWKKQGKNAKKKLYEPKRKETNRQQAISWNVQLFRSINSDSAMFSQTKGTPGLSIKKGRIFEHSIHLAYIHHIRRSKNFIYMENQYFMGSSHVWYNDREIGINNLVPLEIVTKIEDKIKNNERYCAYIVIPMFPEGRPNDKVVQEILFWQFRTIEMMYKRISLAIKDYNREAIPQDYLLFFCLGKREGGKEESAPGGLDTFGTKSFKNRRSMIYVHSKMAIFDDEYIIVGSANINDRSLTGNRDTEIAIGAYQPFFSGNRGTNGDVSAFRKSLWVEHMGSSAPINMEPSSLECTRSVKKLADDGLDYYIHVDESASPMHLLIYPLDVEEDGNVKVMEKCSKIPDTPHSFIGTRSEIIPKRLTS